LIDGLDGLVLLLVLLGFFNDQEPRTAFLVVFFCLRVLLLCWRGRLTVTTDGLRLADGADLHGCGLAGF
jgi:hypothetical protein